MHVLAIEPYFGLSHRTFLEGYRHFSRNEVEIWQLPARKWKWRMRGSAYHFAETARRKESDRPDVVLVSDFLNLADWRALCPVSWRDIPVALYFHENQIGYPLSAQAPVEHHYGWINVSSALAADAVLFNSGWHRDSFLGAVRDVLRRMPDPVPPGLLPSLEGRSVVFPVGIDFTPHESVAEDAAAWPRVGEEAPTIIWNHRWEYDKQPELLASTLIDLARRGTEFRAIVCGESFGREPPCFRELASALGDRLLHLGFFERRSDYLEALRQSHVVLSTACHEFFGIAAIEAIFLGCLPVLPRRLSYPEIVPEHLHDRHLYERDEGLVRFLDRFLRAPPLDTADELRAAVAKFHWLDLAPKLDTRLEDLGCR